MHGAHLGACACFGNADTNVNVTARTPQPLHGTRPPCGHRHHSTLMSPGSSSAPVGTHSPVPTRAPEAGGHSSGIVLSLSHLVTCFFTRRTVIEAVRAGTPFLVPSGGTWVLTRGTLALLPRFWSF